MNSFISGVNIVNSHKTGPESQLISLELPEKASNSRIKEEQSKSLNTSTPKAYGKLKPDSEKPKVPRQIREIQENLTFEKIRRTGTKNTAR
jgi:hypothetical protein